MTKPILEATEPVTGEDARNLLDSLDQIASDETIEERRRANEQWLPLETVGSANSQAELAIVKAELARAQELLLSSRQQAEHFLQRLLAAQDALRDVRELAETTFNSLEERLRFLPLAILDRIGKFFTEGPRK